MRHVQFTSRATCHVHRCPHWSMTSCRLSNSSYPSGTNFFVPLLDSGVFGIGSWVPLFVTRLPREAGIKCPGCVCRYLVSSMGTAPHQTPGRRTRKTFILCLGHLATKPPWGYEYSTVTLQRPMGATSIKTEHLLPRYRRHKRRLRFGTKHVLRATLFL